MDRLPQLVCDKIFEYLSTKDIFNTYDINEQCQAAGDRQLKWRCQSMSMSTLYPYSNYKLQDIFDIISEYVKHVDADFPMDMQVVSSLIASCSNLESLHYKLKANNEISNSLDNLKTLSYKRVRCEKSVTSFLTGRCKNLQCLKIEQTNFTGKCLTAAPINLRRLSFIVSFLEFQHIHKYLQANKNLEELEIEMDDATDLSVLLQNVPKVHTLGLFGQNLCGYEQLAELPLLKSLTIEITNADFFKYPEAMESSSTHQLNYVKVFLGDGFVVTQRLAESFEKFTDLCEMVLHIGKNVRNAELLVPHLNHLGAHCKLTSLRLAGSTQLLGMGNDGSALQSIPLVYDECQYI